MYYRIKKSADEDYFPYHIELVTEAGEYIKMMPDEWYGAAAFHTEDEAHQAARVAKHTLWQPPSTDAQ